MAIANRVDAPRALVFFPYLPHPVRDGAQARCTAMLRGLVALGYDVTLLVSVMGRSDIPSAADVRDAEDALGLTIHVHTPGPGDHSFISGIGLVYGTGFEGHTPPSLFRTFRSLAAAIRPDVVLVNYGYWATLVQRLEPSCAVRLVDMHDLVSLHVAMSNALATVLPQRPLDPRSVPDSALREDFFRTARLQASQYEFDAYDSFDGTIAISAQEAALVRAHTRRTSVAQVPMMIAPGSGSGPHDGPPVFVMSDTLLNQQGYAYLVRHVVPRVRAIDPAFSVRVVGTGCRAVLPADGVELVGPVDSLADEYSRARFAICPLIGGTGQQVKVIEAMAHALPVVALDDLAARSPLVHGVNALRAADADAFAASCHTLWSDAGYARRLGQAARETVSNDFNPGNLPSMLGAAIADARAAARARMAQAEEVVGPVRRFLASGEWDIDGQRVAIYGTGSLGQRCRSRIGGSSDVVAFVDSDQRKNGLQVDGLPVVSPNRLSELDVDLVVVASMYWPQILNNLRNAGWNDARVRVF